jgi:glycosyltransferase involved in cell wall biosynthesis
LLDTLAPALKEFSVPTEVILLDNASADCLRLEEVARYQLLFNFRVIRHSYNIGFACNYLATFCHSTGEWCWVLGDDDVYDFPNILEIFKMVDSSVGHDDYTSPSLIHINHSHFTDEANKRMVLKERVHSLHSDALLSETDFLELVTDNIGGLLFVSSNIIKMSCIRQRLKVNYLTSFASSCVCLAVPLIAIQKTKVYVIADPLIKDRLGEAYWMERAEMVFRLELPCSIFASQNPTAIKALAINNSRLRSFAKTVIVGIMNKDLARTFFFISQFLWFRFRFCFHGTNI